MDWTNHEDPRLRILTRAEMEGHDLARVILGMDPKTDDPLDAESPVLAMISSTLRALVAVKYMIHMAVLLSHRIGIEAAAMGEPEDQEEKETQMVLSRLSIMIATNLMQVSDAPSRLRKEVEGMMHAAVSDEIGPRASHEWAQQESEALTDMLDFLRGTVMDTTRASGIFDEGELEEIQQRAREHAEG